MIGIKSALVFGLRICVALNLLSYGYHKLTGEMFDNSYTSMLTTPLKYVDNFHLTWYWFHKNREFSIFIGVIQIISAVLLVFDRYKFLGAILALPILIGTLFIDAYVVKSPSLSLRITFYIFICLSILYKYRKSLYNIVTDHENRRPFVNISTISFLHFFLGVILVFTIELLLVLLANISNLIFTKWISI